MKTKTSFAPILFILLTASAVMAAPPTSPEPMSEKTALQFFTDKKIRAGWNLGNTLDAVTDWKPVFIADETAWGNPLATQQLFNGVNEVGFDIVRIPVTWLGHIGPAPTYTISPARLERVAQVIEYGKNAGIKAMIINIHHDGNNTQGDNTTWGFVDFPAAVNSAAKKAEIQNQISVVWTQIAEYFKNYGDYLIFETLNEVHNGNWGIGASAIEQDILFDWNQAALNAIRATGGNNATRFVAVPGLGGTEPDVAVAAHARQKLLPDDGDNGTKKLIVSIHYYAPGRYTVAGVTDQAYQLIHTWGSSEERAHLAHEMESLKTYFIDNGIAVYIGEYGAPTDLRSSMSETIKKTHLDYIGSVVATANANGVVPIYWDAGDFKMLERSGNAAGWPKQGLWFDVLSMIMKSVNETATVSGQWEWSSFTDEDNSGTSTITFNEAAGTVTVSGNVTNGYEHGFVGWQAVPDDNATKAALASVTTISFKVTGDGKTYRVVLPTSDITDYCYYQTTFAAPVGETTITLNISDFAQPNWGAQKPFNKSLIESIQWQSPEGVFGSFSLTMKDLSLKASEPVNLLKITASPSNATVAPNAVRNLTVTAVGSGTLSYQWYRNTTASNTGGTLIPGATSSTYALNTATEGTFYYYVIVTNTTDGGQKSVSTSDVATINVDSNAPIIFSQIANSNIRIYATGNSIMLQNLPQNAKVQVYNLSGKLISSKSFNQVNHGSDVLRIPVQTKGMYFVKANKQTQRVVVK